MHRKAFVIMPFKNNLMWVYKDIIRPACNKLGVIVSRADDIKRHKNIMRDIVDGVIYSDVIIADVTGANPNVFYELGVAHSLLRPVVILTQRINNVPFDLRSQRVIDYSKLHQKKIFKDTLVNTLIEALKIDIETSNPIGEFMSNTFRNRIIQANKHAKPVGTLSFYRDGNKGAMRINGNLNYGLVIEPSFHIDSIHWGSPILGWGWDGRDAVTVNHISRKKNIIVRNLPVSKSGDIQGTPYIRTIHKELIYFDLEMWLVKPDSAIKYTKAGNNYSAMIEYPLSKLRSLTLIRPPYVKGKKSPLADF